MHPKAARIFRREPCQLAGSSRRASSEGRRACRPGPSSPSGRSGAFAWFRLARSWWGGRWSRMLLTWLTSRLAFDVVLLDELLLDVGQLALGKDREDIPGDASRVFEGPVLVVALVEELLLELVTELKVLQVRAREARLAHDFRQGPQLDGARVCVVELVPNLVMVGPRPSLLDDNAQSRPHQPAQAG